MTLSQAADFDLDWPSVREEAIDLLRQYLRFPTVNDPRRLRPGQGEQEPWVAGDEAEAARWIAGVLKREGIPHEVLESAPRRLNVVARLSGASDTSSVTLLSHSDVVPAPRQEWTVDPFGAVIKDGYLYGRGSLDLKGLGIAQLMVLVLLRRMGVPLGRDVVLLVVADEETGGRFGAEWLVENRRELLDTGVVLGEGGFSPHGLQPGVTLHAVAVAEKGCLELELTAEGRAHHASIPAPDAAPSRLVRALGEIAAGVPAVRLTPPATALLRCLADGSRGLHRLALSHPRWAGRALTRNFLASPLLRPMVSDTVALTAVESVDKSNVVPARARARLSIRLLPGTDPDHFVEQVRAKAARHDVAVAEVMRKPATSSPFDTHAFRVLARQAAAGEKGSKVTPILSPATSDARHWRKANVATYGWVPFVLPVSDLGGVHGPQERVSLDGFVKGMRTLLAVVAELVRS